jgi:phage antirepressor YoqD-like protein
MEVRIYQPTPTQSVEVLFDFSDQSKLINATQMAKPFKKLVADFLRLDSVNDYIHALKEHYEKCYGISHNENISHMLLLVRQTGSYDERGTWMCPELALRFAQWLNPKFAVWVDVQIQELLKKGSVSLDLNDPLKMADAVIKYAQDWKQEYTLRVEAESKIKILEPKAQFYDTVASSKDLIDIETAAKLINEPGFGRNNLYDFLRTKKVIQQNNRPYQCYVDLGWFKCVETNWTDSKGYSKISYKTMVYQKGLKGIISLIKKHKEECETSMMKNSNV